jgi:hypothetical protein
VPNTNIPALAAHIGLDWADKKHYWSMKTADGKRSRGELEQSPEAIHVWIAELKRRFNDQPIAIISEQSRGALIANLGKYANVYIRIVDPARLAYYRKSVSPSGAKSDPVDADLILDFALHHPDRLRCLDPDTVETRSLQLLTELRRDLVNTHTSQVQTLTHWLKLVFPQMLTWFDEVSTPLVCDFLQRWPRLTALRKARRATLLNFFHQHNCRSEERNQARIDQISRAVEATSDEALLRSADLMIATTVQLLTSLRQGIEAFDAEIKAVFAMHPDRALIESLPGAGSALEPRLIAALGTNRDRFKSAQDLASFAGIAPVTESSGQSRWVHWRWSCPKFIRQTFHEWAACTIRLPGWANDHYQLQRTRGKGHHAAVRSVAFKWLRILYRCWRDRTPYSEERYLNARRQHTAENDKAAPVQLQTPLWKTSGDFSTLS